MSQTASLQSLESLLETFLDRVVFLKEKKLNVLDGINRLDDIGVLATKGEDVTDDIGGWFATHNKWLTDRTLKDSELNRITGMLSKIKNEISIDADSSMADQKISSEIDRWNNKKERSAPILKLKRMPEVSNTQTTPLDVETPTGDTISLFVKRLSKMTALFMDYSNQKNHILSVLEDLIRKASTETSKDALILSAFIIYYLKQNGYKVEPFVKKLKEAETLYKKGMF